MLNYLTIVFALEGGNDCFLLTVFEVSFAFEEFIAVDAGVEVAHPYDCVPLSSHDGICGQKSRVHLLLGQWVGLHDNSIVNRLPLLDPPLPVLYGLLQSAIDEEEPAVDEVEGDADGTVIPCSVHEAERYLAASNVRYKFLVLLPDQHHNRRGAKSDVVHKHEV